MMDVATYTIQDGLSQKQRAFPALQNHYVSLYEFDWIKVFSLMREYARTVDLDTMFTGQELAVVTLLLSMDSNRPDIRKALERGDGVQGLRGLLQFCEKELASSQSVAGLELQTLVQGLLNGVRADYGPSEKWKGANAQSALLQAVQMAQKRAQELLPGIWESGVNEPAVSLYAVFARLHERIVAQINRLPSRRMQFYYQDILCDQTRPMVQDRVHLIVPVIAVARDVELSKGTEFASGNFDHGSEIIFRTVDHAILNDAVVQDIRTMHFQNGVPWADQIPIYDPSKIELGANLKPYPLFGNTRDGLRPVSAMVPRIGFTIASPILFLQEGSREITFRFEYELQSVHGTVLDVSDHAEISRAKHCETFLRTFKDIFSISATTEQGWYSIAEYNPSFHLLDESIPVGSLCIRIRLASEAPGVIPYDSKLHGEAWKTQLPVFRFMLNPEAFEYNGDLLQQLILRHIFISASVEDFRKLVIHNQIGPLSAMAPFQPFGPLPAVGDYLIIGCQETLGKNLQDFHVDLEWNGLPEKVSDFCEWYEGYGEKPSTKDFIVRQTVLSDGRWHPNGAEYPVVSRLFQSDKSDRSRIKISSQTGISFKSVLPSDRQISIGDLKREFQFGPESKNGFFKISLAQPFGAFQHKEYPHVLSKILTYNARVKNEHFTKPLPNAPYTPVISSIKVSYRATANIPMSKSGRAIEDPCRPSMQYIHPWGWEDSCQTGSTQNTQIPSYQESGSLFIGLRMQRIPKTVSLYFHLSRDSEPLPENADRLFSWWYLSERGWVSLPSQNIQRNSTNLFTCSGIVNLILPPDMTSEHSLMPSGLFWIRISAAKGSQFCCRIFSVFAQAIEVERVPNIHSKHLENLPSGTIKKMRKSIAGLGGVYQVAPSWGGRSSESQQHQRTRIAERLLHKNRAYTPKDYERLILESFPQVFKVKCFTGINPSLPSQLSPGHLTLVPLSHLFSDGRRQWKPRLAGHILSEMEKFLQPLMPPSAILHVVNPYFEKIQVRCSVQFRMKESAGILLKKLNEGICNYLSPWHSPGYQTHFGWCARRHDLEAYIRDQSFVENVSECSLIRISPQREHLFEMDESGEANLEEFRGAYPWSVAVPMRKHYLNVIDGDGGDFPLSVGIGDLEIGSTFILQPGKQNGENK